MSKEKVLVVSPHPDDESIGAGGTLLKYKRLNSEIDWLIVTNMNEKYGYAKDTVKKRNNEIEKVRKLYGFSKVINLGLRPAGLDEYSKSELVNKISKIMDDVKPSTIIIPFKNDIHSDHRIVYEIMLSCSKIFRHKSIKKILMMEIVSETDYADSKDGFLPNYFVDITKFIDLKLKILRNYSSEFSKHPFPRSIENITALAIHRGAQCNASYAESFVLLKYIE